MKSYQKTLDQFTQEITANPPMSPGGVPIFETLEEIETQWLLEIEEAIDDGEDDIPSANLESFADKPADWLTR